MGNVVPAEFFLFSQRMRRALYYDRFSLMDSLRAESFFIFGEPMGVYHYGENNV